MTVPASWSKWAHPPRSNTPRSSSPGPPGACITPSTETCVVVISFMVAAPFSVSWSLVGWLTGSRGRSPPQSVHTTLTSGQDHESHQNSKQGAKRDEIESSPSECGTLFQPVRSVCPGDTPPPNHEQPPDASDVHGPEDRAVLHHSGELRARREFAIGPGRRCVAEEPRGWTTGQRAPHWNQRIPIAAKATV